MPKESLELRRDWSNRKSSYRESAVTFLWHGGNLPISEM